MPPLRCPRCAQAMREVRAEQLVYDRCDCGALWFDSHELDEYMRWHEPGRHQLEGGSRSTRRAQTLVCPRCAGSTLAAFIVDGVPLHACNACRGHLLEHESALAQRAEASSGSLLLDLLRAAKYVPLWWPW